tara:strand:+ start:637 stop:852 length:216 start_codon:yes stop_codon:yes gene_type:complete
MAHKFVVKRNGILETYTEYNDIPNDFDHVISFEPEVPEPPHTEEQHDEIEQWNDRLKELMEIEHARSNKKR